MAEQHSPRWLEHLARATLILLSALMAAASYCAGCGATGAWPQAAGAAILRKETLDRVATDNGIKKLTQDILGQ